MCERAERQCRREGLYLNIGIVSTWFERGAAYVSRQYYDVLSSTHKVFVYARGGEQKAIGDSQWDFEHIEWGKNPLGDASTVVDREHFVKWVTGNNLDVVFFNEQRWWQPIIWCTDIGVKTGAYIDYYTKETVKAHACYDFLVCNTRRHYEAFKWHEQSFYIPWGTNVELFKPRERRAEPVGIVTFFNSAGFNPYRKGVDLILQAFEQLDGPARLYLHTQIPLVSSIPNMMPTIRRLKDSRRLEIFEGTVHAPGLYHKGDVYVYPSRLDGIGLTVPEALACGIPVITTDHPPMNEFVESTVGMLVPTVSSHERRDGYYWPMVEPSIEGLAGAMQWFVDNRPEIPEMQARARCYSLEHLDWTKNAARILDVFENSNILPHDYKKEAQTIAQGIDCRHHGLALRMPILHRGLKEVKRYVSGFKQQLYRHITR